VWTAGWAFPLGAAIPDHLVADGIPEPSAELRREVGPYLEFRTATLLDWHPQRRDILISTRAGNVPQLHRVRLPGGFREPITFESDRVAGGSYAPGRGDMIVFSRDRGGDEFFQLFRLNPDRGEAVLLTDGRSRHTSPRWADSGQWLAYVSTRRNGRDTDLYVMDPRSPDSDRRVTEWNGGGWSVLDWSPDGKHILALAYVSAAESSLHVIDVETGRGRQVSSEGPEKVSYGGGAFLPDGRSLLVMSDRGSPFRRLARLEWAGGREEPFGPMFSWGVEEFELSPDGSTVAVLTNEGGISVCHLVDMVSGKALSAPRFPMGVVSGLRWRPGRNELACTLSSARVPGDVYSVDMRGNRVTRWTRSETGGLDASKFGEAELVRTKSFDGLEISGFLYRPDAKRFPGPRPVVVQIHGGPEGQSRPQYLRAWNYLVQELGVAVLLPNVRGSEGYGKDFLTLDNGRRREDSVRDIGAFLDWIATDPGFDAGRVAVYGASYGGYMVLASMIQFGDRLRCGVDVVGISNFRTFLRNTQDYRRDLRRAEYGDEREPEMAAFLERISPLGQASEIRKPLLVVQGRNDPRVPVTESEQMVEAIRAQGGTVWYLMAKDEGHGFAKKSNQDFLFLTFVEFLKRYLIR